MRKTMAYVLFLTALMIGLIYFLSSDLVSQKEGELVEEEEIDRSKPGNEQQVVTLPDLSSYPSDKDMKVNIDGQEETITMTRHTDQSHSFVIYVDTERFIYEQGLTQTITSIEQDLAELIVEHIPDQTPEQVAEARIEQLSAEFNMEGPISIEDPFIAKAYKGTSSAEHFHAYLIDDEAGTGVFILTSRYPLSATDAIGARLQHMMESFEVVDTQ